MHACKKSGKGRVCMASASINEEAANTKARACKRLGSSMVRDSCGPFAGPLWVRACVEVPAQRFLQLFTVFIPLGEATVDLFPQLRSFP